ncbi:hypothetical protein LX64_03376 [Chitinophaga skermanii]|uniref:Protochlamydia outer membrane protein domain-containing protein n=2 Tax=Chitinophaga skermanii TaxID=331697 RepID=A0A327QF14_9BACT|nr:hypothetical protein LX64_03376 [Chitinophaga skermanii]
MRKSLLAAVLVVSLKEAQAQSAGAFFRKPRIAIDIAPQYSHQYTRWSIAGNAAGTNPNVLSELIWKDIQTAGLLSTATIHVNPSWFIRGEASWSGIISGTATDRDYGKDNRSEMLYNGFFDAGKGRVFEVKAGLGYEWHFNNDYVLQFNPDFVYQTQNLYLLPADANTPSNLRSTYNQQWKGVQLKVNFKIPLYSKFFLHPNIAYTQLRYNAVADWNMVPSFQHPISFKHQANGYQIQPGLKLQFANKVFIQLQAAWWHTGAGREWLYMANDDVHTTKLNEVYRRAFTVQVGVPIAVLQ